ncbi:MAG: RNA-binding proteins (RRM domain) [Idiomarinaceae bacterium HL-53]|nr:MAG: RNA-binding proteins (RRM domain) [Idiomarinaceae bacterium HL-53]CUS48224.1 RNA recognition motif. (a.k.a. RRM, RBD, or RNP domain) [Idiomarinaceae bacterium HL-53]
MEQAHSAQRILVAALLAVVFTLISRFFIDANNGMALTLIALGTFLGGALTPFLAQLLSIKRTKRPTKITSHSAPSGEGTTLYVGNLPFKTDEASVEATFSKFGNVISVRLVKDRRTGRKKGYGFVEMDATGADLALAKLNDREFEGRTLKVRLAHSEQDED